MADDRPAVLVRALFLPRALRADAEGVQKLEDEGETDYVVEVMSGMDGFEGVFEHFQPAVEDEADVRLSYLYGGEQRGANKAAEQVKEHAVDGKGEIIYSDDEMPDEEDEAAAEEALELSKRKQKKLNRLSVAELKRLVKKPEVVDWVDVSATDPKLLVQIKSHRNTVPIPSHWSQKRDYLQGKRGIEKPAFQLPSAFLPSSLPLAEKLTMLYTGFIADTGIATQMDAVKEKETGQGLKATMRAKVQPKMGKIDIDYQKLHDAFFKFQTKPKMTDFGELSVPFSLPLSSLD